ncbi:hypothetical protein [Yokenella regensburgei]|uniref:hypothetical protein n=1 Tax=Yokenella regensburgei TaxID=158877 RepID=UPI001432992B|nr:hypothetical protein [Yokenella regensburgei]QIU92148.1 hypothetical protein HEC60_23880 [Yokenella regensburgei]
MATRIEIINRALTKLGSDRLMSEADDNAASRAVAAIYDGTLDNLLRTYRWSFAIKRMQLSQLTEEPVFGYQFAYQLPSDCIRIDLITDYEHQDWWSYGWECYHLPIPRYQVEGRKILTDMDTVYIRYGARMPDPTTYDEAFTESMACKLAAELCETITQSSTKKQAALQDFDLSIKAARSASAIERPPIKQQDTSWFTSRL